MTAILVLKLALDAVAALGFLKQPPMALMFFGFAIADLGALWISTTR